jgi:N-acetylglucosaminyldiphosphoundecaprenol N-acetyl-beta-D-mannosaminyltransferase
MGVSMTSMAGTMELLDRQIRKGVSAYVCVANLGAAMEARRDTGFRVIQNNSLLTLPDGMPLVWYAWITGETTVRRITGPDLLIEILKVSSQYAYTHYFYGDTKETLDRLSQAVQERFPGTIISGMCSPPFRELSDEEIRATAEEINRLSPSFVWVALGCPKQERWMARMLPHIQSAILVGVGAAFRFFIGEYRHPPAVLQLCGLEGIFWRSRRYPIANAKWYSRSIPFCASLMITALFKRVRQRTP